MKNVLVFLLLASGAQAQSMLAAQPTTLPVTGEAVTVHPPIRSLYWVITLTGAAPASCSLDGGETYQPLPPAGQGGLPIGAMLKQPALQTPQSALCKSTGTDAATIAVQMRR
jgi:hypothetical protein